MSWGWRKQVWFVWMEHLLFLSLVFRDSSGFLLGFSDTGVCITAVSSSVIEVTWRPWIYRSDNAPPGQSCKRRGSVYDHGQWKKKIHLEATSNVKRALGGKQHVWFVTKRLHPEEYATGLPARKCMWVMVSGCHFYWEICSYGGCKWPWCNWTWQIYWCRPHYMGMQSVSLSTMLSYKWFTETHPKYTYQDLIISNLNILIKMRLCKKKKCMILFSSYTNTSVSDY